VKVFLLHWSHIDPSRTWRWHAPNISSLSNPSWSPKKTQIQTCTSWILVERERERGQGLVDMADSPYPIWVESSMTVQGGGRVNCSRAQDCHPTLRTQRRGVVIPQQSGHGHEVIWRIPGCMGLPRQAQKGTNDHPPENIQVHPSHVKETSV